MAGGNRGKRSRRKLNRGKRSRRKHRCHGNSGAGAESNVPHQKCAYTDQTPYGNHQIWKPMLIVLEASRNGASATGGVSVTTACARDKFNWRKTDVRTMLRFEELASTTKRARHTTRGAAAVYLSTGMPCRLLTAG